MERGVVFQYPLWAVFLISEKFGNKQIKAEPFYLFMKISFKKMINGERSSAITTIFQNGVINSSGWILHPFNVQSDHLVCIKLDTEHLENISV